MADSQTIWELNGKRVKSARRIFGREAGPNNDALVVRFEDGTTLEYGAYSGGSTSLSISRGAEK